MYDLALECNNNCIQAYDSKYLSSEETSCVENCFKKQKIWNDKFYAAT